VTQAINIEVLDSANSVAQRAAAIIAADARAAVAARSRFVMAVSGGHTPWVMLRALAAEDLPWQDVHVVQVDERVAPAGHPDRNLTHLRESLLAHAPLVPEQLHDMPVEPMGYYREREGPNVSRLLDADESSRLAGLDRSTSPVPGAVQPARECVSAVGVDLYYGTTWLQAHRKSLWP
jgi:6-phosphogluconolactonase/glucosamine-6-phosphate isomerase/deaminase